MQQFVNDFSIFFNKMFECIISMWNWIISTTLGEIIIFLVLISIFLLLINQFINFKD